MIHNQLGPGGSTLGPVKKRITRACDQCSHSRTKCDGKQFCAHCIERKWNCTYVRERKKRGKASRRDVAQQQAATTAGRTGAPDSEDSSTRKSSEKAARPKVPRGQRSLPKLSGRQVSITTARPVVDIAMYQTMEMSMGAIDVLPAAEIHPNMTESMQFIHPIQPPRIQTHELPMQNLEPEYTSMEEYHRNLTSPNHATQNASRLTFTWPWN